MGRLDNVRKSVTMNINTRFQTNAGGHRCKITAPMPTTDARERFRRHIRTVEIDGEQHRIWTGSESFNMGNGRIVTPKRAALELLEIDLPLHCRVVALCGFPGCVAASCLEFKV